MNMQTKMQNIVNQIWPWKVFRRLEKARDVETARLETETKRLKTIQQSSQSYRRLVSGFQAFCQNELPEDIWHSIVQTYMEGFLPGTPDPPSSSDILRVRNQMDEAGLDGIQLWNPDKPPVSLHSEEMDAAWDRLRKKWESERDV
jgi:hypothetical protein